MSEWQAIDRQLLASVIGAAQTSPRRRKNYNFHCTEAELSHHLLNAMGPDSYIRPHCHADATKDKSIIVLRGKIGIVFFDAVVNATDARTRWCHGGGEHSAQRLPQRGGAGDPGSVFFEAKAGTYVPLTVAEKAPWAPDEDDPAATDYLAQIRRYF